MMTAPLISCILPTYNRRPFIAHAIAYFQRQSYDNRGPSDSAFSVPGTDEFAWVVAVAIVSWCSPMVVFVNDGIRLLCVLRQFSLRLSTVTKQ